jgi:modification methylase
LDTHLELNKIYNEDCLVTLSKMADNSVDLVVTSPPYNKNHWIKTKARGKDDFIRKIEYSTYDDNLPQEEYVEWQKKVISECLRVLKPTGSLFYNHIDIMSEHLTIHPTWVYDFPLKQVIIWDKCGTPKIDKSYFLPFTEWIFWIKKEKDSIPYFDRNNALFKKNIWSIPRSQESNHPAPFSEKMVENVVLSCSKEGDVVYDPFMGSGTTYKVSRKHNRNVIGSEISEEYTKLGESKVNNHEFF